MWQLEQGLHAGMRPAQGTVLVTQHQGCPESGSGSRREPEDSQAPPAKNLPSETEAQPCSRGALDLEGETLRRVPG